MRAFLIAAVVILAACVPALAQASDGSSRGGASQDGSATGGAGFRSGNITSTGETVPNPGASQSEGTTSLDRGIQQDDNKIQNGICKGC